MRNYNEIINEAKKYPQLEELVEEVEEMRDKGYTLKSNIIFLKREIDLILASKKTNELNDKKTN